jgi:hypothetical protein
MQACNDNGVINVATYMALDKLSLDELLDIIEMQDVLASWQHAHARNDDAHTSRK